MHCIVIVEAIEDAEPVNTVVNLEALEGAESIVRLDELGGNGTCPPAVDPARLHSVARVERAKNGRGHQPLQLPQLRPRTDIMTLHDDRRRSAPWCCISSCRSLGAVNDL